MFDDICLGWSTALTKKRVNIVYVNDTKQGDKDYDKSTVSESNQGKRKNNI